jgi:hypothetical protein
MSLEERPTTDLPIARAMTAEASGENFIVVLVKLLARYFQDDR